MNGSVYGMALDFVGAVLLAVNAVRFKLNREGNLEIIGVGRRGGAIEVIGWVLLTTGFGLQLLSALLS